MARRLDLAGVEGILDRVGQARTTATRMREPGHASRENRNSETTQAMSPRLMPAPERQEDERGADRVGVLEHRAELRHRHQWAWHRQESPPPAIASGAYGFLCSMVVWRLPGGRTTASRATPSKANDDVSQGRSDDLTRRGDDDRDHSLHPDGDRRWGRLLMRRYPGRSDSRRAPTAVTTSIVQNANDEDDERRRERQAVEHRQWVEKRGGHGERQDRAAGDPGPAHLAGDRDHAQRADRQDHPDEPRLRQLATGPGAEQPPRPLVPEQAAEDTRHDEPHEDRRGGLHERLGNPEHRAPEDGPGNIGSPSRITLCY